MYSARNLTCSNVSMALRLLRLRTRRITRSKSWRVSLLIWSEDCGAPGAEGSTSALVRERGSVSTHPHRPSLMIQQQATRPARPMPPLQWTSTDLPLRVYVSMMRWRWLSKRSMTDGASPSGMGSLRRAVSNSVYGARVIIELTSERPSRIRGPSVRTSAMARPGTAVPRHPGSSRDAESQQR